MSRTEVLTFVTITVMERLVIGLLSPKHQRAEQIQWNQLLEAKKLNAYFDVYKTENCTCPECTKKMCLTLRLSEMFLLGRRGYIIDISLQKELVTLIDELDSSAKKAKRVDTIVNEGGIVRGYCLEKMKDPAEINFARFELFFGSPLTDAEKYSFLEKIAAKKS